MVANDVGVACFESVENVRDVDVVEESDLLKVSLVTRLDKRVDDERRKVAVANVILFILCCYVCVDVVCVSLLYERRSVGG